METGSDRAKWWPPAAPDVNEDTDTDDHDHHPEGAAGRSTAPQSEYTARDVAFGAVVGAVGLLVTFGVPLLVA